MPSSSAQRGKELEQPSSTKGGLLWYVFAHFTHWSPFPNAQSGAPDASMHNGLSGSSHPVSLPLGFHASSLIHGWGFLEGELDGMLVEGELGWVLIEGSKLMVGAFDGW
jgi:hypothetical protein